MVPVVAFDQIYSFDRDSLLKAIPAPKKEAGEKFSAAASELFDRIMLMADNAGATDDHRAVNYLAVRYPAIYHTAAEMFGKNAALSALEVRPSSLSGTRRIVDVVFTRTGRPTSPTSISAAWTSPKNFHFSSRSFRRTTTGRNGTRPLEIEEDAWRHFPGSPRRIPSGAAITGHEPT